MMRAVLTATAGPECDRQWAIDSSKPVVVGRGDQADVVIIDAEISRLHCQISCAEGEWFVEDNQSLNGTFVNGKRIQKAPLRHGDSLHVGNTSVRFDIAEAPAARPEPDTEPDLAPRVTGRVRTCRRCGRELPLGSTSCPVCGTGRVPAGDAATVAPPGPAEAPAAPAPGFAPPKIVRIEKETTIGQFIEKHPHDTSNVVLSLRQKLWYLLVIVAMATVLVFDYLYFLLVVHLLCTFYLVVIGYKLVTIFLSVVRRWEVQVRPEQIAALQDDGLPVYTILVPLYKEREVADKIVRHIAALDYPKDKLDVKILLEPDDPQTLAAIRESGLPEYCEVIICPDSQPKTKPKACNHGLASARGEYVVIYDAEDRPEPDQLKKAIVGFRRAEQRWEKLRSLRRFNPFQRASRGRTVCLQAKLNYYNPNQNLLTKWFMIEYATWFQLYLPGLHALRAPIPLGGTSNHFRTDVLREISGWDPFNVTEDCDLGIRLYKLGYRTQVIDSTTWEEANSRLGNWIRQRSRWVKGYVQTHLTHMRHPLRTLWKLRPWGMFNFLNSVGGLSLMLLLNPIFWAASLVYVGLFAADLHEHGYSFERALGVHEAIADAADVRVKRDRTIRIPHPKRWAWPMICTAWREDTPKDAEWTDVVARGIKNDWARLWRALPGARNQEPSAGAENTPQVQQVGGTADESKGSPWNDLWAAEGFHFWNIVSQVLFICTICLVLGNVFFVLVHVIACLRAGMPRMIPLAILMPLYWVLISLAAWKGFLQLFWKPFYWEKTQHGLDVGPVQGL